MNTTTTTGQREAALYEAEASRYRVDHRTDPAVAAIVTLSTIAEHCVSKAAAILPNVSNADNLIAAMYHTAAADLPALFRSFGADVDELTARRIVDLVTTDPDTFRTYDDSLLREDPPRFDPTWSRPRVTTGRGVEVRGRRDGFVIGSNHVFGASGRDAVRQVAGGSYGRMAYAEAVERAELWSMAVSGEALPMMIGTDTYSWEQVITWKPIREGSFTLAAEGAGSSLVGDGRKKRTNIPRSVSYGHDRFYVRTDIPGWAGMRILKEYRTNVRVRLTDEHGAPMIRIPGTRVVGLNHRGEPIARDLPSIAVMGSVRMIGHRVTSRPKQRKVAAATRAKRVPIVDVVDVPAILIAAEGPIRAAVRDKVAAQVAYRTASGIVVRCRVDINAAVIAVQVTTTNADGVKRTQRTNVRDAAAMLAAIRNRTQ